MNDGIDQSSARDQYSYQSSRFWCFNCSREFSHIKLSIDSEVLCPTCDHACEEISDPAHHPHFFQSHEQTQSNIDINNSYLGSSSSDNTISSTRVEEPTTDIESEPRSENTESTGIRRIFLTARPRHRIIDAGNRLIIQTESPILIIEGNDLDAADIIMFQMLFSAFGRFGPFRLIDLMNGEMMTQLIEEFIRNDPNRHGPPPASEKAISELTERKFDPSRMSKTCTICQDDYIQDDPILDMPCEHDFHKDCLGSWLKLHNTCPICRKEIEPQEQDKNSQPADSANENSNANDTAYSGNY